MFLVESEGQTFSLKPMNCPESTFIYRSQLRSYRDLPLRLSEYGVLHRNELSGVLSGLTRVRHFVHGRRPHLRAPDQIQDEIQALMGEVREVVRVVRPGARRSRSARGRTRRSATPHVGARRRRSCARRSKASGVKYRVKERDGAFYAPKIDIQIRTPWAASGRRRRSRSTA